MHNFNYDILDKFDFNYSITDEFCFSYLMTDEFDFNYDTIDLNPDASGQIWLFEGGYFRRDGIFIRGATFNRN